MKNKLVIITLLASLALVAGAYPVWAGVGNADPVCDTVSFYVYNGTDVLIDFESSNWTPGATYYTWYGYLDPGEDVRHTLSPGLFEFYTSAALTGDWYLDQMVNIPPCSRVEAYVKMVKGEPALRIRVSPPKVR